MIVGRVERSKMTSEDVVILEEKLNGKPPKLLLRAYTSKDAKHVRIFLPEFTSMAQPRLRDEVHIIDFERDVAAAKKAVKR